VAHDVETMAYSGRAPWHGLGAVLRDEDVYDWGRTCARAGLDWGVELAPLVTADDRAAVAHRAVRRTSDGRVLGVVGPRYAVLQNRDAFGWFAPFLDAREARLETAGSLRGGSRVWVLARLNRDPLAVAPGDEVERYVLLSHGHDGTLAVRVGFVPIRVVCANTLALAHGADASELVRVRHTGDVRRTLASVREVVDLANREFEASAEQYRLLARTPINQADLTRYVRRVLGVEDGATPGARTRNLVEDVVGLCEAGRGNDRPGVRGTLWAAYNGVTEWLGYGRGRSRDGRLDSLWFGGGRSVNRHALETALAMAA
jgi:phage/plasmid-like protein (TIGR03299 family)